MRGGGPDAALVLAGRRGPADWIPGGDAAAHKALLDVGGRPMLVRVVDALIGTRGIERVHVCIDDASVLERSDVLAARLADGTLVPVDAADSPSSSVGRFLETCPRPSHVLVTAADHALLRPQWVEEFWSAAVRRAADVTVAMVTETRFRASYPSERRTFLPLRGEGYSGANLFSFRVPEGLAAASYWRRVEAHRKEPWRMAAAFGARTLLGFALRRYDIDEAMARVSDVVGSKIGVVLLDEAEAAIDVDGPEDLAVVERLLAAEGPDSEAP